MEDYRSAFGIALIGRHFENKCGVVDNITGFAFVCFFAVLVCIEHLDDLKVSSDTEHCRFQIDFNRRVPLAGICGIDDVVPRILGRHHDKFGRELIGASGRLCQCDCVRHVGRASVRRHQLVLGDIFLDVASSGNDKIDAERKFNRLSETYVLKFLNRGNIRDIGGLPLRLSIWSCSQDHF